MATLNEPTDELVALIHEWVVATYEVQMEPTNPAYVALEKSIRSLAETLVVRAEAHHILLCADRERCDRCN